MNVSTYPGKGLSLSQLIFALNEELKRVAYSPSFTLDAVSQISLDIFTAHAAVREWKNSFVPINRIPLDVLALIPTHLTSHKDRFRASFVCRHWRRVFLQHGALWSQMFIGNGEDYIETLLGRAKGSALDVFTKREIPTYAITQLAPHAQQIRHLEFVDTDWTDIETFSEVSRALPLLHTLKIIKSDNRRNPVPSLPLFSGSLNLEQFILHSEMSSPLRLFLFPNLTTFEFVSKKYTPFDFLPLLEFLKISPTLRTVKLDMSEETELDDVPQGMVIVLPNVETFSLSTHKSDGILYDMAAHISCPYARLTSLRHELDEEYVTIGAGIFPTSFLWNMIVRQYTINPIEEVTIEGLEEGHRVTAAIKYSLSFKSSDATVIRLDFGATNVNEWVEEEDGSELSWGDFNLEVFTQACRTIQDHPLLSHVKRLHIKGEAEDFDDNYVPPMAEVVRELLGSLGPLDEVTFHGYDLDIFIPHFPDFQHFAQVLPPIKELTISEPYEIEMQDLDVIVELAKSQYKLGKPFERVTVHVGWGVPSEVVRGLRRWVSQVKIVGSVRP